jgi:hypothetical protein
MRIAMLLDVGLPVRQADAKKTRSDTAERPMLILNSSVPIWHGDEFKNRL